MNYYHLLDELIKQIDITSYYIHIYNNSKLIVNKYLLQLHLKKK